MTEQIRQPAEAKAKGLFGRMRALRKSESGFTAVEFAMVIGPFLALLFAIMEVALVYFATFSVENATAQAARRIRTGEALTQNMSASDFRDLVCDKLPSFMDCEGDLYVDVRAFPTFASAVGGGFEPIDSNGAFQTGGEQFNLGTGSSIVLVTVFYDWSLFATLPDFGLGLGNVRSGPSKGHRIISSSFAFKNEPFT
jgi:Flp pilus assembly protein TadG